MWLFAVNASCNSQKSIKNVGCILHGNGFAFLPNIEPVLWLCVRWYNQLTVARRLLTGGKGSWWQQNKLILTATANQPSWADLGKEFQGPSNQAINDPLQKPSTMSQSSYISRRSSSRLGDYAEFTTQQDSSTHTEATTTTMLTAPSRVASAKVQELANTNDMLAERMSSYQVLVFILYPSLFQSITFFIILLVDIT